MVNISPRAKTIELFSNLRVVGPSLAAIPRVVAPSSELTGGAKMGLKDVSGFSVVSSER